MKRLILLFVVLFAVSAAYAQGIEFRTEPYAEVLKMAKKQKKLVFVDIYTSWCGPCKHMAANIFTQKEAGDFFNAHFLSLKLDAEKSADGKALAAKFEVMAYPTMLFVDGNGELVYRLLGGRPIQEFVAEGQKALDAYAAKPLLEKNEKAYAKGRRDKRFLLDYYELKDEAGLDCSDVLMDYFKQVKDEELLDSAHVARIAKVSVYDPVLAKRWVGVICKAVREGADKTLLTNGRKSVCTYLGACLKDVAKSDDESKMEEVLALKSSLFKEAGIGESVAIATLGGGNIYIYSDLLRLDYYEHRNKTALFLALFDKYAAETIETAQKKNAEREVMTVELNKKMEDAKKAGDAKQYDVLKKTKGMMNAFAGIDDYYVSTQLLNYLETYCRFYTGVKDKAFEDRIAVLYRDLHRVHPSAKNAVYVADKLMEMGRKQEAVSELEIAVEKGMEAMGVEETDREACRNKLEELRK